DRVRLDLGPQPVDMHGYRALVAEILMIPDMIEQLRAAEHLTTIAHKEPEEIELFGGESDRFTFDGALSTSRIDTEPPGCHRDSSAGIGVPGAAQDRSHASRQLTRAERLGNIVVGAHLKANDSFGLLAFGGHDDDRHR